MYIASLLVNSSLSAKLTRSKEGDIILRACTLLHVRCVSIPFLPLVGQKGYFSVFSEREVDGKRN